MHDPQLSAPVVVGLSAALGMFGGLSSLLRSRLVLTVRHVLSAMLSGTLAGLFVALSGLSVGDDVRYAWMILGAALLAGTGGVPAASLVAKALQNGLRINVSLNKDDDRAK